MDAKSVPDRLWGFSHFDAVLLCILIIHSHTSTLSCQCCMYLLLAAVVRLMRILPYLQLSLLSLCYLLSLSYLLSRPLAPVPAPVRALTTMKLGAGATNSTLPTECIMHAGKHCMYGTVVSDVVDSRSNSSSSHSTNMMCSPHWLHVQRL